MRDDQVDKTLGDILELCRIGYNTSDRSYYERIKEHLLTLEQTEKVALLIRMAEGGSTLVSNRFAYPHIASRVRDLLKLN